MIEQVLSQAARGCYQRSLVEGRARWSGADLRGKALDWACKYEKSRSNLVRRINRMLPEGYKAEVRVVKDVHPTKLHLVIEGNGERFVV